VPKQGCRQTGLVEGEENCRAGAGPRRRVTAVQPPTHRLGVHPPASPRSMTVAISIGQGTRLAHINHRRGRELSLRGYLGQAPGTRKHAAFCADHSRQINHLPRRTQFGRGQATGAPADS
jgi:hypothetical protein